MNKIKELLLKFVKPLVLAHVTDLEKFTPQLSDVIVAKTNLTKEQADSLAKDLINVVEHELTILINKL